MEFDDDRFFSGASRGDFLDALTAHAGLGSTTVLEGDTGSGVSVLLGQAAMGLLDDMEVVRIDGAADHDANVVIEALLRHFNIERPALPEVLRTTLTDGRLVVVADNAEQLQEAALQTMAALKQKLGGRLAYLFGGLPGLVERLKGAGLEVDDVMDLPALNADDIQDFAWFALGLELDENQAEHCFEQTAGNLAAVKAQLESSSLAPVAASADADEVGNGTHLASSIDQEAGDALEDSDWPEDDAFDDAQPASSRTAPPWRHLAAVVGLLVAVLLLCLVFMSGPSSQQPQSRDLALPQPESQSQSEASPAVENVEPQASPMEPTMEPVARLEDLDRPESEGGQPDEAGNVVLTPVSDPVMQSAPAAVEKELDVAPAPAPAPRQDPVAATDTTGVNNDEAAQTDTATTVPASEPELEGLDGELGYRQADWLATRDDNLWFLQITVTSREANARGVLDQLGRKGAYYGAKRNGKVVWLVLAGGYSSRQAALDAKSELPAKLRAAGPFPRKMADIRSEL